jgi:hypothetical protein
VVRHRPVEGLDVDDGALYIGDLGDSPDLTGADDDPAAFPDHCTSRGGRSGTSHCDALGSQVRRLGPAAQAGPQL